MPVTTDVHETTQVPAVGDVVDIVQIPAFLCRQTDLIQAAAQTGRIVNIKKAQFADPNVMKEAVQKVSAEGNPHVAVTERGTFFGYGDLVVDVRNLVRMREGGALVIQDVTHSVQQPAGRGTYSGGLRFFAPSIARAAVAVGVHGLFLETHPSPDQALSDKAVVWPIDKLEPLLSELVAIAQHSRGMETQYVDEGSVKS
mmetsp:Transcript_19203/g.31424  ORF Transcript_19203/g.31424 Transcript_19203/m.31424 type:complete len:199 (+) Transcript_19203:215-811(+)